MTLHELVRRWVGEERYAKPQMYRRGRINRLFASKQTVVQLRVGDFTLNAQATTFSTGHCLSSPTGTWSLG